MKKEIRFREVQRFSQWWLWMLLIGVSVLLLMEGNIVGPLLVVGLSIFFLLIRLKTEIDEEGIRADFFPFPNKEFSWKEVKNARVVNYGFAGGWGVRYWAPYGTIYSTRGSKGLAIELQNGEKFCLGTQREVELRQVLEEIRIKFSSDGK